MYLKNQGYRFIATIKSYRIKNNTAILILDNPIAVTEKDPLRDHLHLKVPKELFWTFKEHGVNKIEFSGDVDSYEHANATIDYLKSKKRIKNPRKFKIIEYKESKNEQRRSTKDRS